MSSDGAEVSSHGVVALPLEWRNGWDHAAVASLTRSAAEKDRLRPYDARPIHRRRSARLRPIGHRFARLERARRGVRWWGATRGRETVCGDLKIRKASRCIQRPFCRVDSDAKHGSVQIVNLLQVTVPTEDTHRVAMIALLVNVMTK